MIQAMKKSQAGNLWPSVPVVWSTADALIAGSAIGQDPVIVTILGVTARVVAKTTHVHVGCCVSLLAA